MKTIESLSSAHGQHNDYEILQHNTFFAGGETPKTACSVRSLTDGDYSGTFQFVMRPNIMYERTWRIFNAANLPVIPGLLTDSKHLFVFTPDLFALGFGIYGKGSFNITNSILPHLSDGGFRFNSHLDQAFLVLTDMHRMKRIRERAYTIAHDAARQSLFLPWDDPFDLLIAPDGESWGLLSIDLETGGEAPSALRLTTLSDVNKHIVSMPYEQANMHLANKFISTLTRTRHAIRSSL